MNGRTLDHLVYATTDLQATVNQLEHTLGVRATPGGRHETEGTHNALIALGPDSYLEVLAPDPTLPPPAGPRWFGIDHLTAPRLVTWAVKATDLGARIAEAHRLGVMLGAVRSGGRLRTDGVRLSWQYSDPHVIVADGIVPFLIDWGDSLHPAQSAVQGVRLLSLRAEHPAAARVQAQLQALGIDLPVSSGAAPALIATVRTPLGDIELR